MQSEGLSQLFRQIRLEKIPYQVVPVEKLNRITRKNHQGVIAFVSLIEYQSLQNLIPVIFERGEMPLLVVADGITDVRNIGAMARSAECAGAHALVIPEKGMAPINADAIKSSAGALSRIPVCRERHLAETMVFLQESGIKTVVCDEKAGKSIYDADLSGPLALIMGSEDRGVSSIVRKLAAEQVSIPMQGRIASLNVSVATGIVLFEAIRQRTHAAKPGIDINK